MPNKTKKKSQFSYGLKNKNNHSKINKTPELNTEQNNFILGILNSLYKLTKFILNNPAKSITLGLAGQVVGSNGFNRTQNEYTTTGSNFADLSLLNNKYFKNLTFLDEKSKFFSNSLEQDRIIPIEQLIDQKVLHKIQKRKTELRARNVYREEITTTISPRSDPNSKTLAETPTDAAINYLKRQTIKDCIHAIQQEDMNTAEIKWHAILNFNKSSSRECEIKEIIETTYTNLLNFENVNNFIINVLSTIPDVAIGYKYLIKKMKENNSLYTSEIVQFGYRVKEYMLKPQYRNTEQRYKDIFESLKSDLPIIVRNLIWKTVCIKNIKYNGYISTGTWSFRLFDGPSRRNIYFTENSDRNNNGIVWEFLPQESNAKKFLIKSHYHGNEYLAVAEDYVGDTKFADVFALEYKNLNKKSHKWVVELVDNNFIKIKIDIKSMNDNRDYLYLTQFSCGGHTACIYTNRDNNFNGELGSWYLEDCSNISRKKRSLLDNDLKNIDSYNSAENKVELDNKTLNKWHLLPAQITGASDNVYRLDSSVISLNETSQKKESLSPIKNSSGNQLPFFGLKKSKINPIENHDEMVSHDKENSTIPSKIFI